MGKILALLLFSLPSFGAISVVNAKQNCTATPCTVTSTTAGNFFLIGTDSSTKPTAANVKLGTQTSTLVGCELRSTAVSNICAWVITSVSGSQTSVTCTSCGTVNAIIGLELSGIDATHYLDSFVPCFGASTRCNENGSATIGSFFTPGYSSDFIFYQGNCSGSSSSITASGITLTTAFPNGEPNGQGIVTSTSQISMAMDSACGHGGAYVVALKGSGASQTSTSNLAYQDYTATATSGSLTLTAYAANAGDLMIAIPWCLPTCTISTLSYGSQNFTCNANGVSDSNTGEGFICSITSVTAAGSATLTFTPGGSPSQYQVLYIDIPLSGQTTIAYDTSAFANCASSCSEGTTITLPSITPTTGDLLLNFINTQHHVTGYTSPWGCNAYLGSGETLSCFTVSTVNGIGNVLNASSGSTSANATILDSNDPYQSLIAAFKYTSTATGNARRRVSVIQ